MSRRRIAARPLLALSLVLAAAASPALAQQSPPTQEAVLGHAPGTRITRPAEVRRYFEALRAAAPDRMVMGDYGTTWEGRPLFWAAVGSPANIARLDAIKAATRALGDPRRTSPDQARALIADTPVIVWMAYSVHGNEISPADAAMAAARRLMDAADAEAQGWMQNAVVVFVPTQNPDGRDRFITTFEAGLGAQPNPDPLSAERSEPWPSGRYNHNLFDLNRDWFIQSQPETQGHAALIRDWRPQVLVDSHEMGTDSSFFFPPEANPLNPWIFPQILDARERFGRNNGARFDQAGLAYFTRETYDAFYPGYGDGWPAYFGAVSMTYEQGSSRGLMARRRTGEVITYADTVKGHLTASLSTIETAARDREKLLNDFYAFHRDGVAGRGAYVLSRSAAVDPAAADKLAGLLVRSGLEVGRATASFSACGQNYRAGDYVVNLSQPQRRMAEVLLAKEVPLDPKFVAEQEARRARGLGDEIYDLTGWSMPLLFNVPSQKCAGAPSVQTTAVGPELIRPVAIAGSDATYGYAINPGTAGMRFLTAALKEKLPVRSIEEAFTLDGKAYAGGAFIVPRSGSPTDLDDRVRRIAADSGAEVTALATSWVSSGPNVGSDYAFTIKAPRVAMAWDDPTDAESAGSIRHVLEREYGWPVTAVRTRRLGSADLSHFEVLILPSGGNYKKILGADGVASLRAWVEGGGVLIGVGSASRLLTDPDAKLLDSRRETAVAPEGDKKDAGEDATVPGVEIPSEADYLDRTNHHGSPDSVAGVLAHAVVDQEHWLGAGVARDLSVMVRGADIYTPLTRGEGTNVVRLAGPNEVLASGQLWAENRRQLAYKPVAMATELGRGQVVAFTQDVTMRAFLEGLKPLFLNAVFRGPAHTSGGNDED
ncbi:M14 metallopeptidase family protein [Brevundimonas bullata]|uniref:M14 metallopeptidase family protein n=1 Tax=Brevundimonas bullata TaxID=13160 RepID=UPI002FD99647